MGWRSVAIILNKCFFHYGPLAWRVHGVVTGIDVGLREASVIAIVRIYFFRVVFFARHIFFRDESLTAFEELFVRNFSSREVSMAQAEVVFMEPLCNGVYGDALVIILNDKVVGIFA
jgi:hypothetical protein